jgi:hypothetical protein
MLFLLAIVVIVLQSSSIRRLSNDNERLQNNQSALQDSVRITYNKWKEAEYNQRTYVVANKEELQNLSKDLYNELKKVKGEIKSIQKATAVIIRDTIPLVVTNPTPNIWKFSYDTTYNEGNYEKFSGIIDTQNPLNSRRTGGELGISLALGFKEVNGVPNAFITSKFPGLKVTNLENAVLDKNYFASKAGEAPLITITANVGQNAFSWNYRTNQMTFFKPEINGTVGVGVNIGKLLKKK